MRVNDPPAILPPNVIAWTAFCGANPVAADMPAVAVVILTVGLTPVRFVISAARVGWNIFTSGPWNDAVKVVLRLMFPVHLLSVVAIGSLMGPCAGLVLVPVLLGRIASGAESPSATSPEPFRTKLSPWMFRPISSIMLMLWNNALAGMTRRMPPVSGPR